MFYDICNLLRSVQINMCMLSWSKHKMEMNFYGHLDMTTALQILLIDGVRSWWNSTFLQMKRTKNHCHLRKELLLHITNPWFRILIFVFVPLCTPLNSVSIYSLTTQVSRVNRVSSDWCHRCWHWHFAFNPNLQMQDFLANCSLVTITHCIRSYCLERHNGLVLLSYHFWSIN